MGGLKNQKSKFQSSLSFVGVNEAGLSSKLDSFENMLKSLMPSVVFLEETKLKQQGRIKTDESKKYQIFQLLVISMSSKLSPQVKKGLR